MALLKIIIFTVALLLCLGAIAGGAILCWQSGKQHTCGDWQMHSPYYPFDSCGYTSSDFIAASKCDTLCYCVSPGFSYTCIGETPSGVSSTFIGGGIVLIVVGIVGIILIFIWLIRKV